nr:hypothetical protein [Acinetobacter sp. Marseille-Q1620]
MKNSFLFIAVLLIITVNKGWADFNSSKLVFYNIGNSYILYSHGNEVKEDYIWLKLAGYARKGQAISGDCDLLFGGNRKNNIINGKALHYETDISSNDDIQNVKAMVNDQYITFDNDEMFGQCGLNVVYGSFLRSKLSQKKYDKQIKEIIVDNLYDAKNNNNPNQRAFSNLVDNLNCSDILNNIQEINDIGFYLQQRKYSINSEKY